MCDSPGKPRKTFMVFHPSWAYFARDFGLRQLAIEIEGNPFPRDRIYIDEDEVDPLLNALKYLIKIKYDVTTLPSFEASFTTKAGLRVMANSIRREGAIQPSLQYGERPKILLSSIQLTQLYGLIDQARKNLASLKAGN